MCGGETAVVHIMQAVRLMYYQIITGLPQYQTRPEAIEKCMTLYCQWETHWRSGHDEKSIDGLKMNGALSGVGRTTTSRD